MPSTSTRPRVIRHVLTSTDRRIVTDGWQPTAEVRTQYEQVQAGYQPDRRLCGRITMGPFACGVRTEAAREHDGGAVREDVVVPGAHDSFAFAVDRAGGSRGTPTKSTAATSSPSCRSA